MATYIVTFEITNKIRKTSVKEKLKEYGAYCPIHDNTWAVSTESKAKEIRDNIGRLITDDDKLFVIRSGTEAAWKNSYGMEHNDWLKKYL